MVRYCAKFTQRLSALGQHNLIDAYAGISFAQEFPDKPRVMHWRAYLRMPSAAGESPQDDCARLCSRDRREQGLPEQMDAQFEFLAMEPTICPIA
jgi:hypothetical protein